MIGSGGLNQPVSRFDAGTYSNAVITGNLTGLGRFHAFSPVLQNNQFRASLPSGDLSSFEGISVGVEDVSARRTLAPVQYYDTQLTIPDAGWVQRGLNAPGSSRLSSPYVNPPSVASPRSATELFQLPDRTDIRVDRSLEFGKPGEVRNERWAAEGGKSAPPAVPAPAFRSAVGSSIFGMPGPVRFRDTWRSGAAGVPDEREGELTGEPSMQAGTANVGTNLVPEGGGAGRQDNLGLAAGSRVGVVNTKIAPPTPEGQAGADGRPTAADRLSIPAKFGDSRFADLVNAIRVAQQLGVKHVGFELVEPAAAAPGAAGGAGVADRSGGLEARPSVEGAMPQAKVRRSPSDALAELATAATWARDLFENPMVTFTGQYEDRFNRCMAAGEAALRSGEYYRAAGQFDLAHTIDPSDPLPLLQRGHALAAAGDYVSAVASLKQGIERFPQIAAFRTDLSALAGRQAIFDVRRADLEKRLAAAESYELRFLLGYLEFYSGIPDVGLRDLEQAAKEAPENSVISLFVDLLLNRRELPPVKPLRGALPPPSEPGGLD
jgi:hypothetical protein